MLGLFACTLYVSAVLLFLVQPMVAKMLLPLQRGAPAVWITCVVFYRFLQCSRSPEMALTQGCWSRIRRRSRSRSF